MKTQYDVILDHLREHKTITSREAFLEYGVTRLSAVIFVLKRRGYAIKSNLETGKTRRGTSCTYSVYELV